LVVSLEQHFWPTASLISFNLMLEALRHLPFHFQKGVRISGNFEAMRHPRCISQKRYVVFSTGR
jgi:hypothetical protein